MDKKEPQSSKTQVKRRKLVVINQNAGYLTVDVANACLSDFQEVALVYGYIRLMERKPDPSITTRHIIRYDRSSTFRRLYTWTIGTIQTFFLLLFRYRSHEILYFTNPPMVYFCSLFFKRKFSLVIWDTYPDALQNIGIGKHNPVYRLWASINKKVFPKAQKIITLAEGMADLLSQYVSRDRITVVHNWSGSAQFRSIPKHENPFVRKRNYQDRFVVQYSGNMGLTHDLEVLIELAERLKDRMPQVFFLMIGEGGKKQKLQQMARERNLENMEFLTWQEPDELPFSMAAADISVVTVNAETSKLSVPSKTYNILASGTPMLCIAEEDSELANIIETYHCGRIFNVSRVQEMADFIAELAANREQHEVYSENARKASESYTYSNAEQYVW